MGKERDRHGGGEGGRGEGEEENEDKRQIRKQNLQYVLQTNAKVSLTYKEFIKISKKIIKFLIEKEDRTRNSQKENASS